MKYRIEYTDDQGVSKVENYSLPKVASDIFDGYINSKKKWVVSATFSEVTQESGKKEKVKVIKTFKKGSK